MTWPAATPAEQEQQGVERRSIGAAHEAAADLMHLDAGLPLHLRAASGTTAHLENTPAARGCQGSRRNSVNAK